MAVSTCEELFSPHLGSRTRTFCAISPQSLHRICLTKWLLPLLVVLLCTHWQPSSLEDILCWQVLSAIDGSAPLIKSHSDWTEADSSPPPASSWRWTAFGFFSTTIEIETLSCSPMFILWVWAVIVVALPTRKEDWALRTRVKMTLKTSIVKRKMKSRSVSNMAQLTTLGGTVQQWCPWAKHFARLSFTFHLLFILVSLEEVTDFVTQLPTPVYVPNVKWQKATI